MGKPTDSLDDFEAESNATQAAGGALLDDEPVKSTAPDDGAEVVDFDNDEIYRRPGELALCAEKVAGQKHRFSVMPDPADGNRAFLRRAWTHYVQGKGFAKCHSKRDATGKFIGAPAFCCCTPAGPSEPRFGAIVVEYTCCDLKTARFHEGIGSPEKPFTFEIKALMLSRSAAEKLKNKAGENDDGQVLKVQQVDYFYTPATQSKGLEYERISGKASWAKNAAIKAQVLEAFEQFKDGKELARRLGRNLSVNQLREHMGIGASAPGGNEESFGDL